MSYLAVTRFNRQPVLIYRPTKRVQNLSAVFLARKFNLQRSLHKKERGVPKKVNPVYYLKYTMLECRAFHVDRS